MNDPAVQQMVLKGALTVAVLLLFTLSLVIRFLYKRRQRFAPLAREAGMSFKIGFRRTILRGRHEGYPVSFIFRYANRHVPSSMTASLQCKMPFSVRVRSKNIDLRLRNVWVDKALTVEDDRVADVFDVEGPEHPGMRRFLGDEEVIQLLHDLQSWAPFALSISPVDLALRCQIEEDKTGPRTLSVCFEALARLCAHAHRHGAQE